MRNPEELKKMREEREILIHRLYEEFRALVAHEIGRYGLGKQVSIVTDVVSPSDRYSGFILGMDFGLGVKEDLVFGISKRQDEVRERLRLAIDAALIRFAQASLRGQGREKAGRR